MKKLFALYLLLFAISAGLKSQVWLENLNPEESGFYDMQNTFEQYVDQHGMQKGMGMKPFARWLWFWDSRLDASGQFPPDNIEWTEWNKYIETHQNQGMSNLSGGPNHWIPMGPFKTPGGYSGLGRINCMAFDPVDTNTFWIGSPAGGLWKTSDAAHTWTTSFDQNPSLGVSGIAINPIHPDTMYVATGDGDRGSMWAMTGSSVGDTKSVGELKSTDGGISWNTTGLNWAVTSSKLMRDIIIDPDNPSVLVLASTDGIWRSADAAVSWTKVQSGYFTDLEIHPNQFDTLYASNYGSAQIYRSTDAGITWKIMSSFSGVRRIKLATTAAAPHRLQALCANTSGGMYGIYNSDDDGLTFKVYLDTMNLLTWSYSGYGNGGQGWYDLCYTISPIDSNIVFLAGVNTWKSTDAGHTWSLSSMWTGSNAQNPNHVPVVHADKHFSAFHPLKPSWFFDCNDGGIYRTVDTGQTWMDLSNGLQISQFYRIGVSSITPDLIIGGLQDNGSRKLTAGHWVYATGGDGMNCLIDPNNDNWMYASYAYGRIYRSSDGFANWWNTTTISDSIPGKPRGWWVTPFNLNPQNTSSIYAGFKEVYKSTNRGNSWTAISSGMSGGSKLRNVIIAPSDSMTILAATKYSIYKTIDGGVHWDTIYTSGPPISYLCIDPANAQRYWITLAGYSSGNKVMFTNDGGLSWINFSGSLPNLPANCIVYQQGSNDVLYLGMDVGVYYRDASMTDWQLYNNGLPNSPVTELEIALPNSRLVAATFGRGIWESQLNSCHVAVNNLVTDVSCFGGNDAAIQLTPSGGNLPYSYLWNTGDTTSSLSGLSAATYFVSVTDSIGCYTVDTIFVTQPLQLNANINQHSDISGCYGDSSGSASVMATGGTMPYEYTWSNGAITDSITGLAAGLYKVTIQDAHQCISIDSVNILQPGQLDAKILEQVNVSCYGNADGSLKLTGSGGTPGYTYLWSNLSTSSFINNLSAGNYSLTLTDTNGCTATLVFTITQPDSLNLMANTLIRPSCYGLADGSISVSVQGGTSPYQYVWSTGDTLSTIQNLPAGNYQLTVSDSNLCTGIKLFVLNQPDSLQILMQSSNDENSQCNGTATASVQGGTANYTYQWDDGQYQTSATAVNLCAGLYHVTVSDANLCTIVDSVRVRDTVINGIQIPAGLESMRIFPNPNKGIFTVLFQSNKTFEAVLGIYDIGGKLIAQKTLTIYVGQSNIDIDLNQISQGMYQVRLISGEASMNKKLFIIKP